MSVAIQERLPVTRLRRIIYPYPTLCGGVGEAIGAYARGIGTVIDPGFEPWGGR
jgi:hypothetical protein